MSPKPGNFLPERRYAGESPKFTAEARDQLPINNRTNRTSTPPGVGSPPPDKHSHLHKIARKKAKEYFGED